MNHFNVPARCTTRTVNKALTEAGTKTTVFKDPYNGHNYSISYESDDGNYVLHKRPSCENARELAEGFSSGKYELN